MSVQYCAKCGEPVTAGERFCGNCGNDVTLPGSVTSAPLVRQGISPANAAPYQQPGYIPPPSQPAYPPPTPGYQNYQSTTVTTAKKGSPLPLIGGVIVLIAILAAGAYFLFLNKSSNNTVVANQPTATPNVAATATAPLVASASPTTPVSDQTTPTAASGGNNATLHQEVTDAISGMSALTGFHAVVSGTYSGTEITIDGDFSKDGSQFKAQFAGQSFTAIYINKVGYISTDDGKTWQTDTAARASFADTLSTLFDTLTFSGATFNDAGQATMLNGDRANKIDFNSPSDGTKGTLWLVAPANNTLVARVNIQFLDNTGEITIDYSKFNEPVNVTTPDVSQ